MLFPGAVILCRAGGATDWTDEALGNHVYAMFAGAVLRSNYEGWYRGATNDAGRWYSEMRELRRMLAGDLARPSSALWLSRNQVAGTLLAAAAALAAYGGAAGGRSRLWGYGLGFAILAGLFAVLYLRAARHPERLDVDPEDRANVRASFQIWTISAVAGLVSAALTFGPMVRTPWLPGFAYWLIPLAIALRGPVGRLFRPGPAKVRSGSANL